MLISIFASIGCHNLWDELILKNEIKVLEEKYWEWVKFKVFTYDINDNFCKKENIEYVEYFPIFSRNFRFLFRNLKNLFNFLKITIKSDLIVVGWWWLFFDNEFSETSSNNLKQWVFRTKVFEFFNKKVFFLWVWLNIKDKANYHNIKKIFSFAAKLTVRDKYSLDLLKELWIKAKLIKDPVFWDNKPKKYWKILESFDANDYSLYKFKNIDFKWKTVWICLRVWYLNKEEKNTKELIDFILKSWWKVLLLPHSFHQIDTLANDYLFLESFVKKWVSIAENMKVVYDAYRKNKIDLCISMRYHSMVLSYIYWIDFVAISYTRKTDELIKELS